MIRINLLPREDKAHKEVNFSLPKVGDLVLPILVLAIAGLVIGGTALAQRSRIAELTRQIAEIDEESRKLAPQIARVNRLAQERAELDLRLGIITKLERGRSLSVRVLDELAATLPEHTWLVASNQEGESLSLEGFSMSNLSISDLMSRLDRSSLFSGVELEVAERSQISGKYAVKFRLTCRVTPDEPAQ
jgi:type IV pilus assembly protein PilN